VDDIDDDLNSVLVGLVDELLELVRLSEPRGYTEEVGDVVAERTVVRMLHNAHDLNNVVAQFDNVWEDDFFKMSKSMNFVIDPAHANVDFINFDVLIFPSWLWMFPFIIVQSDINAIKRVINVLSGEIDPGWNAIDHSAILEFDFALDFGKFRDVLFNGASPLAVFVLNR
jgi:hypothetical protein